MPGTRKLGRKTDHRMSMLKGMVTFLLEKGQIETTLTRAKEVSALTDKMITLGKTNTLATKRRALAFLKKESVVAKLFSVIAPLYNERNGGYTRVLKIGPRRGDGAEMAIIALVDADSVYKPKDKKAKKVTEDKTEVMKTSAKDEKQSEKKTQEVVEEKVEVQDKESAVKTAAKAEVASKKTTEKKVTSKKTTPKKAAAKKDADKKITPKKDDGKKTAPKKTTTKKTKTEKTEQPAAKAEKSEQGKKTKEE